MRIKNIKVPVSRHVIDAAFMAGLPVSLYVLRAVNNAAQDTLDSANRVLLEAGIRDKAYQDMQRDKRNERELRKYEAQDGDSGTFKRPTFKPSKTPVPNPTIKWNNVPADDAETVTHCVAVTPAPDGVHIQGEWHENEAEAEADDLVYVPTSRQRGLIADFEGDFCNTYNRYTTLSSKQVWFCHNIVFNRRLDLGLTTGTDTKFFEEVIAEMHLMEVN